MEMDFFGVKMSVEVKRVSLVDMVLEEFEQRKEELESAAMMMGGFGGGLWSHDDGCYRFIETRNEVRATRFSGGLISFYPDENRSVPFFFWTGKRSIILEIWR